MYGQPQGADRPELPTVRRPAHIAMLVLLGIFVIGAVLRDGHHQIPFLDIWVFNGIYVLAALLCARPVSQIPGTVLAWRLVTLTLVVNTAANVYFSLVTVHATIPAGLVPGGGPDDALHTAAYPASYLAVVLAVRARVPRFPASMWWDGLITGLGMAAAVACLAPAYRVVVAGDAGTGAGLSTAWYPIADLLLLTLLAAGAAALSARWDPMLVMAGLGLTAVAVGDLLYAVENAGGSYTEGGPPDALDLLGVVLLALGAGAAERPGPRPGEDGARVSWRVLALPTTATVGSVLLLALLAPEHRMGRTLAAGSVLAALVRMFLTLREIRDMREVHRQARTDDLTGLSNRRAFYEHCDRVVLDATPTAPAALILLDLDGFKQINDSLGHGAGDDLLIQVAERLRATLAPGTAVARLGGDEFAVLMPGLHQEQALAFALAIERALARSFTLDQLSIHVSTSLGVACAPDAATTRGELLRCADVAMYQAKAERRGAVAYTAIDGAGSLERLRIVEDLRQALGGAPEGGELVVHLQPQVRLDVRDVVGMEALLRWNHPVRGLLEPGAFLPAARAAALMGEVTATVLELSLSACRVWWDQAHYVPVSVNVSAANVHDRALPVKVARALRRHGLPPQALVIELTEDTLMTDPDAARGVLAELRKLGVGISIDDYGTGYSSLAYLRQLPVDELKLDRAFIRDLLDDRTAAAIIRHTVELAHTLGLRLVAEGIEDRATLEAIGRLGCDVAQGYQVAMPMPVPELLRWLPAYSAHVQTYATGALASRPEGLPLGRVGVSFHHPIGHPAQRPPLPSVVRRPADDGGHPPAQQRGPKLTPSPPQQR